MRGVLKAKDERARNDAYFTPDALARAVCERLGAKLEPATIIEPSAGGGAFLHAARRRWPSADIMGIDVAPDGQDVECGDFLRLAEDARWALIIGNPPYLYAEAFVQAGLRHLADGGHLAYLLRLSFLGGQGRAERLWAARNMRWLFPITPRPSFTPDGKTDASEYAIFVWEHGYFGNAEILAPLKWERAPRAPEPRQQGLGFPSGEPRAAPVKALLFESPSVRVDPEEAA